MSFSVPKEYRVLGTWDTYGVPNYLETLEKLPPTLLNRVLENIPERTNIPNRHPNYFAENLPTSLLIQSQDENFKGADVFSTFMYEAAGYKNVVGYYIFALRDGFTVPTKWDGEKYIAMTVEDINAVDENGKSVLKKTIIFPNASLPTWENNNRTNSNAGGGNLLPGSKVRLLYDVEKPETLFPNNTGIGFFVIPNGFSRGNIVNSTNRLYSHSQFNPNEFKQVLQLADLVSSDSDKGSFIISFEDITRTSSACDHDFNDVIMQVSYTPVNAVKVDEQIQLPSGEAIQNYRIVFDRSGMYYTIDREEIKKLLALNNDFYIIQVDIKPTGKQHNLEMDQLEDVFKKIRFTDGVTVKIFENEPRQETKDYYFSESKKHFSICLKVPKENLQSYMYFFNSITNIDNESPIKKDRTVIVDIQAYVVNNMNKFEFNQRVFGTDSVNKETDVIENQSVEPVRVNLVNPFSMGDPHVQTLTGERFDLPSDENIYQLYEDSSTSIRTRIGAFEFNNNDAQKKHLRFMKLVSIQHKNHRIVADLFHRDIYYANENLEKIMAHEFFQLKNESSMGTLAQMRRKMHSKNLGTNQFHLRYIKFLSENLGNVLLELLFIPHRCDTVNFVSLICDNLYAAQLGTGAFVRNNEIRVEKSLF